MKRYEFMEVKNTNWKYIRKFHPLGFSDISVTTELKRSISQIIYNQLDEFFKCCYAQDRSANQSAITEQHSKHFDYHSVLFQCELPDIFRFLLFC